LFNEAPQKVENLAARRVMSDIPKEPERSAADVAHTIVKAVISAVPYAGGPVAELLGLVFGPPLEKRQKKWVQDLADSVNEIQQKVAGLTAARLSENEVFVTTALHATEIAIRTHQQEKLEALRNAVVNSARPGPPDETLQQIFLNCVDTLTPLHLRTLSFLDDSELALKQLGQAPATRLSWDTVESGLEQGIHEFIGRPELADQIVNDLQQRGFVKAGNMRMIMAFSGSSPSQTTRLGKQFLQFISRQ
jgi:hypothetical protein